MLSKVCLGLSILTFLGGCFRNTEEIQQESTTAGAPGAAIYNFCRSGEPTVQSASVSAQLDLIKKSTGSFQRVGWVCKRGERPMPFGALRGRVYLHNSIAKTEDGYVGLVVAENYADPSGVARKATIQEVGGNLGKKIEVQAVLLEREKYGFYVRKVLTQRESIWFLTSNMSFDFGSFEFDKSNTVQPAAMPFTITSAPAGRTEPTGDS